MSKAILVIDMPEKCDECPLMFRHEEERCCIPKGRNSFTTKPSWCPLKEIPKHITYFCEADDYTEGYNHCIDEILGEFSN